MNNTLINNIKNYKISIFCVLAVLVLSFGHFSSGGDPLFENADKVVHFCMYAVTTMALCYNSRERTARRGIKKVVVRCFAAAIVMGIVTEIGQGVLTDYRTCDILDLATNTAGAAIGALISALWLSANRKRYV